MAQRQGDKQRPPGYEPASARSRANTWPLPPEADGYDEDGPPVHEDLQQDPNIWEHHHQRAFSQQAAGNGMMMSSASPLMLGGCKTEPGLRASPTSGADSICGGAAASMLVCKSEPVDPGAEECALLMNCKSEPGLSMAVDDVKLAPGGLLQQPGLSDSSSVMPKPKNSNRRNAWGPHSYADLITQAILSSPEKRLTLAQVYDWMVTNIPWFKDKGDSTSSAGWKNSIRHNLSLHSRFVKVQNEGTGKSSWWMINPDAAKSGKCTRRRATIDSSKFEKKRGRSKKKADPMRNGLSEHTGGSPATGNGLQELDGRFPESPLHPAHPAFLGPVAEFRRAGGPGVPPGWPFRRLESYPQERHHEPMEVTNGMAPPFRSLGYQLYSGQPNGFPSNGHHPPSLMLPSALSDAGERVFNGYQAVSPAASVSSISPSQSSAVDPGSGHYPPPGSEPLYSAAAAAVSSSGYAPSPSSSSFTPSPSNLFTSASPVSSVGSFPVSSFCTSGSLQPLAHLPGFCGDPSFAAMRAAAAANTAGCITVPARDEPETPSQLMSNLMGALQPNNMPVDLDLETFQGGLDCDVDNIIKQELSMDGSLDFSFNQAAAAQAAAAAAQHHMAGVEARHTLTNVYINTSTVNVNVNPRHWQHVNPSLVD